MADGNTEHINSSKTGDSCSAKHEQTMRTVAALGEVRRPPVGRTVAEHPHITTQAYKMTNPLDPVARVSTHPAEESHESEAPASVDSGFFGQPPTDDELKRAVTGNYSKVFTISVGMWLDEESGNSWRDLAVLVSESINQQAPDVVIIDNIHHRYFHVRTLTPRMLQLLPHNYRLTFRVVSRFSPSGYTSVVVATKPPCNIKGCAENYYWDADEKRLVVWRYNKYQNSPLAVARFAVSVPADTAAAYGEQCTWNFMHASFYLVPNARSDSGCRGGGADGSNSVGWSHREQVERSASAAAAGYSAAIPEEAVVKAMSVLARQIWQQTAADSADSRTSLIVTGQIERLIHHLHRLGLQISKSEQPTLEEVETIITRASTVNLTPSTSRAEQHREQLTNSHNDTASTGSNENKTADGWVKRCFLYSPDLVVRSVRCKPLEMTFVEAPPGGSEVPYEPNPALYGLNYSLLTFRPFALSHLVEDAVDEKTERSQSEPQSDKLSSTPIQPDHQVLSKYQPAAAAAAGDTDAKLTGSSQRDAAEDASEEVSRESRVTLLPYPTQ